MLPTSWGPAWFCALWYASHLPLSIHPHTLHFRTTYGLMSMAIFAFLLLGMGLARGWRAQRKDAFGVAMEAMSLETQHQRQKDNA